MKLLATLLLLCAPAFGDTVTQTYEFTDLDVLSSDTQSFVVEPFDESLGTLTDVRYVTEWFRMDTEMVLRNSSNRALGFASGIGTVTCLKDGSNWLPAPVLATSGVARPCGAYPYVPAHSRGVFSAIVDTDDLGECNGEPLIFQPLSVSLINHISPPLSYWTGGPIPLNLEPSCLFYVTKWNGGTWPGVCNLRRFIFSVRFSIKYDYQPEG